jgi:hypothetical protein
VALLYLETKTGVLARDGMRQFVEPFKRIIRDFQIDGRKRQAIGIDDTIRRKVLQDLYVWGRFVQVIHPFVERAWVAVFTVELPRSK